MGWLRYGLTPDDAWEVEIHARQIRECNDTAKLRAIAEQAFRAWCTQTDITRQLISQVAEAEAQLAQHGCIEQPEAQYLQWARELVAE